MENDIIKRLEGMITCYRCQHNFTPAGDYPNGPCPDEWKCPSCGTFISPCCGARIIMEECKEDCEIYEVYGNDKCSICSKCGDHCHCGGCV